jgi:acetoacetyl-CoA synthetase
MLHTLPEPQIRRYERFLRETRGLVFDDYEALWRWSVSELDAFRLSLWDFFELRSATPFERRALAEERMPGARWFEGATLNLAAQALRHAEASAGRPAIVWATEALLAKGRTGELSWPELRAQVGRFAAALRALGVGPGDRVVAYLPNIPQTAVAFLACASLGAVWSVCAPDMGAMAVLDRFRQIEPKLLIAADGYAHGGQAVDRLPLVAELRAGLPGLQHMVLLPWLDPAATAPGALDFNALLARQDLAPVEPEPLPFDHPLWIVQGLLAPRQ